VAVLCIGGTKRATAVDRDIAEEKKTKVSDPSSASPSNSGSAIDDVLPGLAVYGVQAAVA
jgi:hypothetical protein